MHFISSEIPGCDIVRRNFPVELEDGPKNSRRDIKDEKG
jgi:hypothetical protein